MKHLVVYGLADRLHRQFHDVIQLELERIGIRDLSSVGAMIIYNLGNAEMSTSELIWRGCYHGTNVSYNVKRLISSGYLLQVRSEFDKRVTMVKAAKKSTLICRSLQEVSERHLKHLEGFSIGFEDIVLCTKILERLQVYWARAASSSVSKEEVRAFS